MKQWWAAFVCALALLGGGRAVAPAHASARTTTTVSTRTWLSTVPVYDGATNLSRTTSAAIPSGRAAEDAAAATDTVVLGHYPEYLQAGGRTFSVPTDVWDAMSPEEQWAANQKFLDRAIARG